MWVTDSELKKLRVDLDVDPEVRPRERLRAIAIAAIIRLASLAASVVAFVLGILSVGWLMPKLMEIIGDVAGRAAGLELLGSALMLLGVALAVSLPFGVYQLGRQVVAKCLRRALRIARERKQRNLLGSTSSSTVPVAVPVQVADRR